MARSRKPARTATATPDLPYSDLQKQTHDYAMTRRRVRTGEGTELLSNFEIMQRKQFESGVAGNSVSQRDFLRRAELAEHARLAVVEEECRTWSVIRATHQKTLAQARDAGLPLPRVLPHPDDILIDWKDGVQIVGPHDAADWELFQAKVRFRDALYVQQAMEDAVDGLPMDERMVEGAALTLAMLSNRWLPPSLRLSESEETSRVFGLKCVSRRDLLVQCRAAWRTAGAHVTRGRRFGTMATLLPMMDAITDMTTAFKTRENDPLGYEEAVQAAARAAYGFKQSASSQPTKSPSLTTEPAEVAT
jgi:hypothetical protein